MLPSPTALTTSASYSHASATAMIGLTYCPIDDRTWSAVQLAGSAQRFDCLKSDATLDVSITTGANISPGRLTNVGWLSQLVGFGKAGVGVSGFTTFSPVTHTQLATGIYTALFGSSGFSGVLKIPAPRQLLVVIQKLAGASELSYIAISA